LVWIIYSKLYILNMFFSNGLRFVSPKILQFSAKIVAGGGGSGTTLSSLATNGGGGAGGILITDFFLISGNVDVVVGAGAPVQTGSFRSGFNGSNSTITISGTTYTAFGGGGGGGNGSSSQAAALNGGSGGGETINVGGGAERPNDPGGIGVIGQGNNGGASGTTWESAGGGGGYLTAGQNANGTTAGAGGLGLTLSEISKTYSTGGSGAQIANPLSGAQNTGNGADGTRNAGLAGGSGAVLIYVPIEKTFSLITGTVNTYSVSGYSAVVEFITSGSFSLT
jgi:hypothetical protein